MPILFDGVVLVGDNTGRFTDVTPSHGPAEFIYDVFFVDRQHGWVGFTDVDRAGGRLLRTVDGGRTWEATALHAGQHQSAGSRIWLYFLDARRGWAVSSAAAGGAGLYRTSDGGQTWSDFLVFDEGEARGPVEFDTPRHGWMAAWAGPVPGPGLYETFDGGDTWRRHPIEPPAGMRPDDLIFHLPTLHGTRGVLPAAAADRTVAFYSTSDAGRPWRLATTMPVPSGVRAEVGVASPTVWWVIPDNEGPVMVTEDAGRTWTTHGRSGLPSGINDLEVKDARNALAAAFNPTGPLILYATNDAGETWKPVSGDTGG